MFTYPGSDTITGLQFVRLRFLHSIWNQVINLSVCLTSVYFGPGVIFLCQRLTGGQQRKCCVLRHSTQPSNNPLFMGPRIPELKEKLITRNMCNNNCVCRHIHMQSTDQRCVCTCIFIGQISLVFNTSQWHQNSANIKKKHAVRRIPAKIGSCLIRVDVELTNRLSECAKSNNTRIL
jgi:hypothetical protein